MLFGLCRYAIGRDTRERVNRGSLYHTTLHTRMKVSIFSIFVAIKCIREFNQDLDASLQPVIALWMPYGGSNLVNIQKFAGNASEFAWDWRGWSMSLIGTKHFIALHPVHTTEFRSEVVFQNLSNEETAKSSFCVVRLRQTCLESFSPALVFVCSLPSESSWESNTPIAESLASIPIMNSNASLLNFARAMIAVEPRFRLNTGLVLFLSNLLDYNDRFTHYYLYP